jgi:hypothetical protein
MSGKISTYIFAATIYSLSFVTGCAQTQIAGLALRFTPGESTDYKVTTEAQDSIQFEGSLLEDPTIKSKNNQRNQNRTEIIFTQRIKSFDDKGNAITNITITGLKSLSIYQNNTALDFDSSEEKDKNNPLMKLVGQNYTIKISPAGQVISVVDANEARAAVGDNQQTAQKTLMLLSEDEIRKRHSIPALPDVQRNTMQIGDKWSSLSTFSFRQMGPKAYERIYTLKKIENINNRQIAIIEMNAIPSPETAQQGQEEQAMSLISNMFDNIETYTGKLTFDMTAGRIEKYLEKLQTEWIIAEGNPKNNKEPDVIRLKAVRSYKLEKVD